MNTSSLGSDLHDPLHGFAVAIAGRPVRPDKAALAGDVGVGVDFEDEGAIPFAVPALHKRDVLAYSYPEDESFLFEFVHYGEGVLCVVFDVCDLCAVVF